MKDKKFKTEAVYYPYTQKTRFRVVNHRGHWLCECRTQVMANRVIKGLELELNQSGRGV